MSTKRLRWAGLACVVLSALTAVLGSVAHVLCILLAILLFHTAIQVPLSAVGGAAGTTELPIPRILAWSLSIAALLLASGLALVFESLRRNCAGRRPA